MEIDPCVGMDCGSGTCVGNGTTVYCICSPSFAGAACGDIIGRWCVYVCPCLHDSVSKVYLSMQQSRVGLLIQYINNDTLRTEIYTRTYTPGCMKNGSY